MENYTGGSLRRNKVAGMPITETPVFTAGETNLTRVSRGSPIPTSSSNTNTNVLKRSSFMAELEQGTFSPLYYPYLMLRRNNTSKYIDPTLSTSRRTQKSQSFLSSMALSSLEKKLLQAQEQARGFLLLSFENVD